MQVMTSIEPDVLVPIIHVEIKEDGIRTVTTVSPSQFDMVINYRINFYYNPSIRIPLWD